MLSRYDYIYLSPHFDDAALSCGGQIYSWTKIGKSVLIVTIMAGHPPGSSLSDFVQSLHERWQLNADTVARRSAEDIAACRILGADHMHLEIPDCIYRVHPRTGDHLYALREEIFGAIHPAERGLVEEVKRRIRDLPKFDQLVAPLTVGNHVDHQVTRAAAERVLNDGIRYYEDYPYAREAGALDAVVGSNSTTWLPESIPLNGEDLRVKIDSIAAYVSQMSSFFADHEDLVDQVNEYSQEVGGERIWRQTAA